MSSDDSRPFESGQRHSKRRRSTRDTGDNIVLDYRLKHGLCHQCGSKLFKVGNDGELEPVHLPGIVLNGRCLFCYPLEELPNDSPQVRRAIDNAANTTDNVQQVTAQKQNNDKASRGSSNDQVREDVRKPSMTHDQNNDKASRESSSDQVQEDVRKPSASLASISKKRKDPCNSDVISSPSNEPLRPCIRDADGVAFAGRVEQGTIQKGRGVFSHEHIEGENEGKVSVYKGEFQDGMFHGTGMTKDASGCVYEGDFVRGAAHGIGKCRWEGWRYEGQWANDKRHGHGTCSQIEPGGEVYSGSWKDDQWDGMGTLKFAGGGEYVGEFKMNKLHGEGKYTFADGSVYTGDFERDMRHGQGEMTYITDRTTFVGTWKNNWRNGKGSLLFPDRSVWKGEWQGDERNGVGYLHLPDGIIRKQEYVNGRLQAS